jgi:hypothetical protein
MPQTMDFVSDVKSGLRKASEEEAPAADEPWRDPSFSSHEARLPTPES